MISALTWLLPPLLLIVGLLAYHAYSQNRRGGGMPPPEYTREAVAQRVAREYSEEHQGPALEALATWRTVIGESDKYQKIVAQTQQAVLQIAKGILPN